MPLPQHEDYTTEDIYHLPEGTRAELIDGQIYYMAPPTRTHQKLLFSISRTIADYIDSKKGICEVDIAPFAVFLNEDNRNYVEPDISVICDTEKLSEKGCTGAPDWIIEIVSPGSRKMDYFTKLFKYRTAGVREYWIVDPGKNLILVYNFDTSDSEQYTFADTVNNKILESENEHEKEYIVTLDREFDEEFIKGMSSGVEICGQVTRSCKVFRMDNNTFKIILTQGLNKQIRRMSKVFGYNVVKLERVRIMNITLDGIEYGKYRFISKNEVEEMLRLTEKNNL